ncbi:pah4 homeobox protein encoded by the pah4 protein [Rhypophila decipiens]
MEPSRAASPSPAPPSSPSPQPTTAMHDEQLSSPSSSAGLPTGPDSSSFLESDPTHPNAELERHPKGKRKRTAAKDKAVLEAAYNSNPKPDKAARLEIVKRVSLNEKEVQIWFQNRRQNDRRKSRPLSPQEIAALRYGGMQILSSDPLNYNSSFDSEHTSPLQSMSRPEHESSPPMRSDHIVTTSSDSPEQRLVRETPQMPREPRREVEADANVQQITSVTPPQKELQTKTPINPPQPLSQSFPSSVGYLSNRWNSSNSFATPSTLGRPGDDSFRLESYVSSSCPASITQSSVLPPPSSQSSQFRLSLSLEGKAEVISTIPSPPRMTPQPSHIDMRPIRRPNLQRSHSASPSITLPPISTITSSLTSSTVGPLPPRLSRGRSRDVHAWEFACDGSNREDTLTAQAKYESDGSAIAAINLLRSTSSNGCISPLQSNSTKRNAAISKVAPRSGTAKKAKLARTTSSVARLQSSVGQTNRRPIEKDIGKDSDKLKVSVLLSPGGDSDKENWSPDEEGNARFAFSQPHSNSPANGRRPLPSGSSRLDKKNPRRAPGRPLQEYRGSSLFANRASTASSHGRKQNRGQTPGLDIFEDSGSPNGSQPVVDDEVERFMRGDVSPSKKGDVDAVAGLLSLSQGNWR